MKTYIVIFKKLGMRNIARLEAKNESSLFEKLSNRCIAKSEVVSFREDV